LRYWLLFFAVIEVMVFGVVRMVATVRRCQSYPSGIPFLDAVVPKPVVLFLYYRPRRVVSNLFPQAVPASTLGTLCEIILMSGVRCGRCHRVCLSGGATRRFGHHEVWCGSCPVFACCHFSSNSASLFVLLSSASLAEPILLPCGDRATAFSKAWCGS